MDIPFIRSRIGGNLEPLGPEDIRDRLLNFFGRGGVDPEVYRMCCEASMEITELRKKLKEKE